MCGAKGVDEKKRGGGGGVHTIKCNIIDSTSKVIEEHEKGRCWVQTLSRTT